MQVSVHALTGHWLISCTLQIHLGLHAINLDIQRCRKSTRATKGHYRVVRAAVEDIGQRCNAFQYMLVEQRTALCFLGRLEHAHLQRGNYAQMWVQAHQREVGGKDLHTLLCA
jgi:hypothetical protein